MTTSTNSSNNQSSTCQDEENLRDVWAEAYDGWIDVPGSSERVLYFAPISCPTSSSLSAAATMDDSQQVANTISTLLDLPKIVTKSVLFALTGSDPMGVHAEPKENAAANDKLFATLQSISTPKPRSIRRGFGFSHKRNPEEGFVCAYDFHDADQAEAAIVAIAKDFRQGAIYCFEPYYDDQTIISSRGVLQRRTLGACMSEIVEANVFIQRCTKPDTPNAEIPLALCERKETAGQTPPRRSFDDAIRSLMGGR